VDDALGRPHQLGTAQLDFNLPNQFQLEYVAEGNKVERPVMIHRAMLGSIERFLGILIEHCAGAFPAWLAPVQVAILPIADRHNDYALQLAQNLRNKNLRVTVNTDSAKTGAKVAEAEAQKIPYMLIVGDRETASGSVSVRQRGRKDLGSMKVEEFEARILAEVGAKSI
jgi:threonyl-tRNA synthetase